MSTYPNLPYYVPNAQYVPTPQVPGQPQTQQPYIELMPMEQHPTFQAYYQNYNQNNGPPPSPSPKENTGVQNVPVQGTQPYYYGHPPVIMMPPDSGVGSQPPYNSSYQNIQGGPNRFPPNTPPPPPQVKKSKPKGGFPWVTAIVASVLTLLGGAIFYHSGHHLPPWHIGKWKGSETIDSIQKHFSNFIETCVKTFNKAYESPRKKAGKSC